MGYPGADTQNFGFTHDGTKVMLKSVPLYSAIDIAHEPPDCYSSMDGGKMDGFDQEILSKGGHGSALLHPYQFTRQSDVQPLWDLAAQGTLADRMFQTNCGPSFPAHQLLIAGQSGRYNNPNGGSWGCDNIFTQRFCFDYPTLGDELDHAGLSWRYYFYGSTQAPTIWAAYNAIHHIRFGPDWTNGDQRAPSSKILVNIGKATCKLPNVVWLTPSHGNSDHAGNSPSVGDHGPAWVATVTNALAASPCWSTTTVLVTWDDWGGWYDHVPPAQLDATGLGMRVPLIVVGPFARQGYVSHVPHEFGSILNYIETTFGLPSMGTPTELRSDNLADCFTTQARPFRQVPHGPMDYDDMSAPDDDDPGE